MKQDTPPCEENGILDQDNGLPSSCKKQSLSCISRVDKFSIILIIGICLVSSVSIVLRALFVEPISDDLLYRYVLDANPLGSNDYSVLVANLGDAIRSQAVQYFYSNGRTLIHILVQMFAGPWGQTSYSIFLGVLLLSIMILFMYYTAQKKGRINALTWFLVAITYLYLYQNNSRVWYPIAGGLNYLFPMVLVLSYLLLFKSHRYPNKTSNLFSLILLVLIGFITGWSQEAFSLPLSGGVFFYVIRNWKKLTPSEWCLTLSLWIGTAILILAPGNFVRLGTRPGLIWSIWSGINLLIGTYLFWILIIGLVSLRYYNHSKLKEFFKDSQLEWTILFIAIAFGMVANTLPQSFNGISFYSAILFFKLLQYFPINSINRSYVNSFVVIGLICFGFHQYRLISTQHELKRIYHAFVNEYIASPTGVLAIPDIHIPSDVDPFLSNWFTSSTRDYWLMKTLNWHYMKGMKPIRLLEPSDIQAYNNSKSFISHNKPVDNQTNVYQGDTYLWFDSFAPSLGDSVVITQRVSRSNISEMIHKILKRPSVDYNQVCIPVDTTTILISQEGMVGVEIGSRKIKDIEIRRQKGHEESIDTCSNVQ
ncbi:MAG: hypothetical protein K2M06_08610 [Muribaculaceae bacterium]|nr:hypothetical protein [Muribaculaceae bacterium]